MSELATVTSHEEFQSRRFTKIADKFVEIYEDDPLEAAAYAREAVSEQDYMTLRNFITNAFVRAGWEFE